MIVVNDMWCDACGRHESEFDPTDGPQAFCNITLPHNEIIWPDDPNHEVRGDWGYSRSASDFCASCFNKLKSIMSEFLDMPGAEEQRKIAWEHAKRVRAEYKRDLNNWLNEKNR